eukprot:Amastigsp_a519138_6.p3 type:complete len:168 gc:universal Amastigsp_a519138_6:677-174(-)
MASSSRCQQRQCRNARSRGQGRARRTRGRQRRARCAFGCAQAPPRKSPSDSRALVRRQTRAASPLACMCLGVAVLGPMLQESRSARRPRPRAPRSISDELEPRPEAKGSMSSADACGGGRVACAPCLHSSPEAVRRRAHGYGCCCFASPHHESRHCSGEGWTGCPRA